MSLLKGEYYTERRNDDIKELLFTNSMKGRWEEVIKAYEQNPYACVAKITRSGDTALHRAVSDSQTDVALQLLQYCFQHQADVFAYMRNDEGNTPLHLAAALGNLKICQAIAPTQPDVLGVRNRFGETPVFLAALHGKDDVFSYLQVDEREEYYRRSNGDNVLHVAIFFEFFGMAYKIIQQWPAFVDSVNERGVTPLHVLASKPDAFRSSSRLGRFHRIAYSLLVADDEDKEAKNTAKLVVHVDRHNQTQDAREDDHLEIEKRGWSTWNLFPPNYAWFVSFFKLMMKALIVIFLGFGFDWRIKKLERKRELHRWAKRVMDEMVNRSTLYKYMIRGGENPGLEEDIYLYNLPSEEQMGIERVPPVMDTPILIAARKGVCEMVEKILDEFPMAIEDSDQDGKNVVLLAIENRHPQLYIFLLNKYAKNTAILHKLDKKGNSALHMAAKCQDNWSWLIPRSLVQMHQELKWYKFVKSTMPQDFLLRVNFERETPKEAFIKSHEKLIKDVNEWLNRVSESCSVVAALVASVAFATASTIPGGTMSDKGVPTLWGRPAFDVFGLASIVAFCSSVTSLVFFLSMLASRYQYAKDFPLKLFLGFSTLFISIASLVTSFLSGIVFVIDESHRHVAYALYGALCLPMVYLALKQLSLYLDLLGSLILRLPKYGQQ
ncbi:uncharacterized protein LOC133816795 isoform X2 [Humulus lupulus]|uniref:uncharacterized protein LOC133816795 isoform X2 n=1 Tax=Humulus lupulus TaxID=3486 RepID=UPI002B402E65|nr:uncharacterized protein LOC133816795 isoform X2 [Humulus lupulus]